MILPSQMIRGAGLVAPFSERRVVAGMSFGLSPAGYDVRIAETSTIPPGGFILASTVEKFDMSPDVLAYVKDKSTWVRRGLCVQNTVIEPGWRGYLTLELTNHLPRAPWWRRLAAWIARKPEPGTVTVLGGSPIAQIVFHRLVAPTEQVYAGKYQDQAAGPQPAREERAS